jgi:serine/threonine-protein kinase
MSASVPPPEKRISTVRLRIIAGPHQGEEFTFDSHNTLVVGRALDAQWRMLKDPYFSRYHFRVEANPPDCRLEDMGSTNGTLVNGVRVQTLALKDGDRIGCGETIFEVCVSPGPEATDKTLLLPVATAMPETVAYVAERPEPPVPKRLGDFEIQRELGRGAMGVVYHALHATGRPAAIKIIQPQAAARPHSMQLFLREVMLLGQLRHPRIVEYLSHGLHEGKMYLAMEYLPVVEFRGVLDRQSRAKQLRLACGIVCRALEALQFAHERNVVHRDVKPANILVYSSDKRLQVKLADFGLAKNYLYAGFSSISRENLARGTLNYMAPEQLINCRYAQPACDIYAAGVCLYYYLSNALPYELADRPSAVAHILNNAPRPLQEVASDVPPELMDFVARAMAREPSERFASAEHMRQSLLKFT